MGQAKRTQHQQYNFCQRKKIPQLKTNNHQSTIINQQSLAQTAGRPHARRAETAPGRATINNRSAFTLVELVVAISLAAMIMLITAMIFKQASSAFSQSDARSEVYQNV
ncbi:MAG: PulJ/GspJ family protein, partial [Candidatus Scalindua sp.]